jgi:V/A-type H+-transporting ATPase subunit C
MVGGRVSEYAAVHARVRGMYADMLAAETWRSLREAVSYSALIEILKETVYGACLGEIEDKNLTPRRAVYQIKKHLANNFDVLVPLVPRLARFLMVQLYHRYEVDNLKALMRGIERGTPWEQVRYVLFPLGSFTTLDAERLMEAEGVGAAVERLRDTPYYDTLSHAMKRYTTEGSLFPLEVALDLDYWRRLWRDVDRLTGTDRSQARRIVGSLLDATNLMWAIRYRVNHHLSEEEIINYTLPFGYRVHDEDVRAIAAGADVAQVVARVYPSVEDVSEMLKEPQDGLPQMEALLQRYVVKESRTAFVGYPFDIGIPVAYLILTEFEIQDLTVLIEAKASQMPAERFRPYLLIGCEPE